MGTEHAAGGLPVAVITGASRGIGAALAKAFRQAGYAVEASSLTGSNETAGLDVTDSEAVRRYVDEVAARHDRIDVLVNNAGVIDAEVPFHESDPEEWWRVMEVNVRGPYLMARAVMPHMLAEAKRSGRPGRIINMNSGAGTRASSPTSAYYASKSALGRITGAIHEDARGRLPQRVFAFDMMPGVVRTDMTGSMPVHAARTTWTSPHDVVALALALASGDLDAWSGRMVRAGADTAASLKAVAAAELTAEARTVGLRPYGESDPLS